jgi:hypothetical protein
LSKNNDISRLGKTISQLFSTTPPAKEVRPARRPAARPAERPRPAAEPTPDARLRELLAQKSLIAAGKLQVLGLDNIREQLGLRWEVVSTKVHGIVERIIKKRLTPVDLYLRYGDEAYPAYVILFGNLKKAEAQIKCALIAEEIAREILGSDASSDAVEVKTVVATVDGALVAEDVDALDAVGRILEQEADKLEAEAANPAQAATNWTAAAPASPVPQDLGFAYQPVWDVRRNVILTFRCVPVHRTAKQAAIGYDVLGAGQPTAEAYAELDLRVLEHITSDYRLLRQQGQRRLLACGVHFQTLANRQGRPKYLNICRDLPEDVRRDVVFELTGLPAGVVQLRLSELVQCLRPYCREVHVVMGPGPAGLEIFRNLGIAAVGLDVTKSRHSEGDLITAMNRFVGKASELKFSTFIRGLGTKSLTLAAVGAGFDYIDGDGVFPAIDTLGEAHRFKPTDLFAHLMAPKA